MVLEFLVASIVVNTELRHQIMLQSIAIVSHLLLATCADKNILQPFISGDKGLICIMDVMFED